MVIIYQIVPFHNQLELNNLQEDARTSSNQTMITILNKFNSNQYKIFKNLIKLQEYQHLTTLLIVQLHTGIPNPTKLKIRKDK